MRKFFVLAATVLIASAGCHMCATPYDYCSPVIENHYGPGGPDGSGPDGGESWGGPDTDMSRRNAPPQQPMNSYSQQGPQQGPSWASYNRGQ